MIDPIAPRFGLPPSLWIPIAAASPEDIRNYVGRILRAIEDPKLGRIQALLVETTGMPKDPAVPLWKSALAAQAMEQLYPPRQVWVHVDYAGYRRAYIEFGMPPPPANFFLDHVQNRRAIRLRDHSHPYLRLCPVDRRVNTSGGHRAGGEGMEKEFLSSHRPPRSHNRIIYADPMDLTKMLNISPGTQQLAGVRDTQKLFYS